ncbi:MAG: acyl-CoA dehydrogenase family protein [Alphaproteobacteria bacterium]|nr:acyl-CoA dehydrogenase family protein [Alphaproteobacteria bacterium]
MDFSFTEEQALLRNSVSRYLADNYKYESWRKFTRDAVGRDPRHWKQFAELGLLAAPLPEDHGGLGGGAIETLIVMEEFGKNLVVEPYVPTVVIAGGLIATAGTDAQKAEWLPKISSGDAIFAFAFSESQSRYNLADIKLAAKKQGSGFILNGHKTVVIGAPWADQLIVSARTSGGQREARGVSLFIVDKAAKGISTRDFPTVDGQRASEITFENVEVPASSVIGSPDAGFSLLDKAVDHAIAATCAEASGAMKMLVDATVEYSKNRKQFGVPIGKFQVLQHRMVDMFVNYAQATSITLMVTLKLGENEAARARAASAAKAQIGKAGRFVGQQAIQIHGGMGMTDELNVGHFFKRLTVIDTLYGSTDHHLKRFAQLSNAAA